MKIALAQIQSYKGDIARNVARHRRFAEAAAAQNARLIVFPEMSLSGYEPALARDLATTSDDRRLAELQYVCDRQRITVAAGLPTMNERGVLISMVIFQPGAARMTYSKQMLHLDELPFFTEGRDEVSIQIAGTKIVPAICYESLRPEHGLRAAVAGASVYLASVAKPAHGLEKAMLHYPALAQAHGMMVLMCNTTGPCDNFRAAGSTAAWSETGTLIGQLSDHEEGMLIVDTESHTSQSFDRDFKRVTIMEAPH